jgi:hypothetical protein
VQSADEVAKDLLSGLHEHAIYEKGINEDGPQILNLRTIVPLCGLSVNSATVSPVFPSYRKILESDPALAK